MAEEQTAQIHQERMNNPLNVFGVSIIEMTNPRDVIAYVEMKLKGGYLTENNEIVYLNEERLVNNVGLRKIMSYIDSTVNRNTTMSNLDEREIRSLMEGLIRDLTEQLMLNRINWEIKSSEDRTTIMWLVIPAAFMCLKRSFKQGERGFWKNQVSEHTINSQQSGSKSRGLMDLFREKKN